MFLYGLFQKMFNISWEYSFNRSVHFFTINIDVKPENELRDKSYKLRAASY